MLLFLLQRINLQSPVLRACGARYKHSPPTTDDDPYGLTSSLFFSCLAEITNKWGRLVEYKLGHYTLLDESEIVNAWCS